MIVLDGIAFSLQQQGGISTYFRELAKRVTSSHSDARVWRYDGSDGQDLPAPQTIMRPTRRLELYRALRGVSPGSIVHSSY